MEKTIETKLMEANLALKKNQEEIDALRAMHKEEMQPLFTERLRLIYIREPLVVEMAVIDDAKTEEATKLSSDVRIEVETALNHVGAA